MSSLNLTVRFACEVGAVTALVWWGWPLPGTAAAIVLIAFWGAFIGPKSPRRLGDPLRLVCELVIFAAATAGFVAVGHPIVASVFAVAALVTAALVRVWPEPVA